MIKKTLNPLDFIDKFIKKKPNIQRRYLNQLKKEDFKQFLDIFFPNLVLKTNVNNHQLISYFQNLSQPIQKLILIKLNKEIYNTIFGTFIRTNIKFCYEVFGSYHNFLINLLLEDVEITDYPQVNNSESIAKILTKDSNIINTINVKKILILIQKNTELLNELFNCDNMTWFNSLKKEIPKVTNTEFSDSILWENLFITINQKLNTQYHSGWDSVVNIIYKNHIYNKYSFNYQTIYNIALGDGAYRYCHQQIPFQIKFLDFLLIPYYSSKSKYELLSTLFVTQNYKRIKELEDRFFNHKEKNIDSCGLLFTSAISEVFTNYGLRQSFQKIMINKNINSHFFFYCDFKEYFHNFIKSLHHIKNQYGEARLLKLLCNCDWGEDINLFAHCSVGFDKLVSLNLFNKNLFNKNKPKHILDLHTLLFKIIGNHECKINLIDLKKDESIQSIDNYRFNDFKFIIPNNNLQLNQFSIEMGNCVRGYTDQINKHNSKIINIYKANKAYANIEILNGSIREAKGKYNKEISSSEIVLFKEILKKHKIIR